MHWHVADGQRVSADQLLCEIDGNGRALLTAERSALNFLQLLSAVATKARIYADAIDGTGAQVVDTRKTLPGLRIAPAISAAQLSKIIEVNIHPAKNWDQLVDQTTICSPSFRRWKTLPCRS